MSYWNVTAVPVSSFGINPSGRPLAVSQTALTSGPFSLTNPVFRLDTFQPASAPFFADSGISNLPTMSHPVPLLAGLPLAPQIPVTSLDEALAAIQVGGIEQDMAYLADNARQGRSTPSPGLSQALAYAEDKLKAAGWEPGGRNGTFRYTYPLWGGGRFATVTDAQLLSEDSSVSKTASHLTLKDGERSFDLYYGADYIFTTLKSRETAQITGEAVYAEWGTEDDLKDLDVQGKWVVCEDVSEVSPQQRRALMAGRGARGLILLPGPVERDTFLERKLRHASEQARLVGQTLPYEAELDEIAITQHGWEQLQPLIFTEGAISTSQETEAPLALHVSENRILTEPYRRVEADNVVGFWRGQDPQLANEVTVLVAHIDHIGVERGEIFNGADDNASGSAALLALAQAIPLLKLKHSVLILLTSGEELGLRGSAAFARDPALPEGARIKRVINLDMISANADNHILLTPSTKHLEFNDLSRGFIQVGPEEGFTFFGNADEFFTRSDHASFADMAEVAFLTSGLHARYHQPEDDVYDADGKPLVNFDKIRRIARLVLRRLALLDETMASG